jgi:hypothetical protein
MKKIDRIAANRMDERHAHLNAPDGRRMRGRGRAYWFKKRLGSHLKELKVDEDGT